MMQWNRRNFMKGSLATAAATRLLHEPAGAAPQGSAPESAQRIVDTHVYLSRWPGRRMIGDQPGELVSRLRKQGVVQAWAGSFDALLHKDIAAVNERLAADCAQHGKDLLIPFGAVNPMLPDWEEDVRRCHEQFRMPGIRVHPNYHAYTLNDPAFSKLLRIAAERNLIVQLVAWMEDERTQIPALEAQLVDLLPLVSLARKHTESPRNRSEWFCKPEIRAASLGPAEAIRQHRLRHRHDGATHGRKSPRGCCRARTGCVWLLFADVLF